MFKKKRESYRIAYDSTLVPPLALMRSEGIDVLEEWFRWGEEWSMLLRVYGQIQRESRLLEIGCGLGRVAFPLRYLLSREGRYEGFEIVREKVEFLQKHFQPLYPNFRFTWANVRNTYYNPTGEIEAHQYRFPYSEGSFDLMFAASVFTHMLPQNTAHYFAEAARVLKPGGRCLFSFFLLDLYRPGQPRPHGFARPDFDFDFHLPEHGDTFAMAVPDNPEQMTAYRRVFLAQLAKEAGLSVAQEPVPGLWSGSSATWAGAQDLLVLQKG
jgi:SAM-dependent methyltransferase